MLAVLDAAHCVSYLLNAVTCHSNTMALNWSSWLWVQFFDRCTLTQEQQLCTTRTSWSQQNVMTAIADVSGVADDAVHRGKDVDVEFWRVSQLCRSVSCITQHFSCASSLLLRVVNEISTSCHRCHRGLYVRSNWFLCTVISHTTLATQWCVCWGTI